MTLRNVGAGKWRGTTLAELEAELQRIRAMGAPDDADAIKTAPASTYLIEVQWLEQTPSAAAAV
jgi:hypothetical protein